ncbi:hypothetical protein [Nonomuraea sediminis]|uniref:hypothetical protein n=1 Tax=Nonomuraea sediminis TaxID=2835864 RepID=UPI001BDCD634|nr:hypothetical protein [Nonomuraea sediminis]
MSQRRSGLLSGLIVGFIASLVCALGVAAAVYVEDRLPAVLKAWNGWPLATGIALLAGVIIGLAMGAVRPRSLLLPPLAALYAGAAEAAGLLVGIAPHSIPVILPLDVSGTGAALRLPRVDEITDGLRPALGFFLEPIRVSWPIWLVVAVAAVVAFLTVALRVRRVRRRDQEPDETQEPEESEYRAPFEPAQAPTQQSTADLFTPRKPTQNQ